MASNSAIIVETDFLVIGAGPAGSSMGSFLGQNGKTLWMHPSTYIWTYCSTLGMKGIVISSAPGTADTPRAHLVNPFALGNIISPQS